MNIFVESNFLLELALEQHEFHHCTLLLAAAAQGQHQLYIPVYSLTEVFQTLGNRRIRREETERYLQEEIKQHLREAGALVADMDTLERLLRDLLLARTAGQTNKLFELTERIARVATLIPLSEQVLQAAPLAQVQYNLTPQDALVYASVWAGLQNLAVDNTDSLFISRNEKDFKKPDLLAELRQYDCDYLSSFRAAAGRLRLAPE
ncbi:MAG: hypothetical protein H7Z21_18510 [Hymenobacter sp.]|nr:hypothetical protein [Hymenobacter sp.]